jgi:hypothetical protein
MLGYAKRLELIDSIPRFDMLTRLPDEIDFLDFDELDRGSLRRTSRAALWSWSAPRRGSGSEK